MATKQFNIKILDETREQITQLEKYMERSATDVIRILVRNAAKVMSERLPVGSYASLGAPPVDTIFNSGAALGNPLPTEFMVGATAWIDPNTSEVVDPPTEKPRALARVTGVNHETKTVTLDAVAEPGKVNGRGNRRGMTEGSRTSRAAPFEPGVSGNPKGLPKGTKQRNLRPKGSKL